MFTLFFLQLYEQTLRTFTNTRTKAHPQSQKSNIQLKYHHTESTKNENNKNKETLELPCCCSREHHEVTAWTLFYVETTNFVFLYIVDMYINIYTFIYTQMYTFSPRLYIWIEKKTNDFKLPWIRLVGAESSLFFHSIFRRSCLPDYL